MPAFTAIGLYVASAVTGLTFASVGAALTAGAFAFAAIATITTIGISYLTSRIINGNPNKGGLGNGNQGGRVQLPPATNNKIPVVYGSAYMNGVITDAKLTTDDNKNNNIMYYCIVLSETVNDLDAAYTVGNIYWNDLRLEFGTSTDSHKAVKGWKKVESTTTEDFSDSFLIDSKHLAEIRIYAGNSTSTQQIFPTNNKQNAYSFWGSTDSNGTNGTGWTSANQMQGLVFAIVKMRYNADKGFTGLPNLTFQLNNSISNPASVFKDYMTSTRYGAGISSNYIDDTALNDWLNYSNELITYTDKDGVPSQSQPRYRINGVIDTSRAVKENIDVILQNGGAWLSYDVATGFWRPIVKRAATAGELSSALRFNDSNILSGITISSTSLDDLYNGYEAEFFDKYNKDQRAYTRGQLTEGQRNANEPDNFLRMGLELCNNSVQADLIAGMEVKQSRDDLVVEFTASHYGIQAQAGDVIYLENDLYGWTAPSFTNGKLFRVLRTKEIETEEGGLIANIQALEYNADVYTPEALTEFTTEANIGIFPRVSTGTDTANIQTPENDRVSVVNTNPNDPVPSIDLVVKIPTTGGPYDEIQVWYAVGPTTTSPTNNSYTLYQSHKPAPPEVIYDLGRTITVTDLAASTNTLGSNDHGLQDGDQLYYYTTDQYGLMQNSGYWVINATEDTFQLTGRCNCPDSIIDITSSGTGLSIPFDTCHIITITGLPANVPGQKYYFKVRVCSEGFCSEFTDPDDATVIDNTPTTPWNPYGGAGFEITDADEGDMLYYDSTDEVWRNTSSIQYIALDDRVRIRSNTTTEITTYGITAPPSENAVTFKYLNQAGAASAGNTVGFNFVGENSIGNEIIYLGTGAQLNDATLGSEDVTYSVVLMENGVQPAGSDVDFQLVLESDGDLIIRKDLTLNRLDENIDSSINFHVADNAKITYESDNNKFIINKSAQIIGDLTVDGTTTTINSTVVTIDDPVFTLGGDTPPTVDDNKDRGIEFRWHNGTSARLGFFGFDDSTGKFTFIPDATNTNEVFSGTKGGIDVGNITAGNIQIGVTSANMIDTTTGNLLLNSAGGATLIDDDVTVGGDLTINGNDIKSSTATAITLNGANVTVQGDLTVAGADIITNSTSASVYSSNVITGFAFNAATTLIVGATTGTTNIRNNLDVDLDLNIDGGDLTTTTSTFNLLPTTATTVNAFAAATTVNIGATTGTTNIKNSLDVDGDINIDGGDLTVSTSTFNLANTTATTVNAFGAATAVNIGNSAGQVTLAGDLQINGNDLKSSSGNTALTLVNTDVRIANDLQIMGNDIISSTAATAITLSGADVTVAGDLQVNGNDIKSSTGATAMTLVGDDVYIADDLRVLGDTIGSSGTASIIRFSGLNARDVLLNYALTVTGDLTVIGDRLNLGHGAFGSATLTTTTTAANQVLVSILSGVYRTMKCTISITSGTAHQSVELLVMHDDTNAYFTTYADLRSGANLATFNADINAGQLRLLTTPVNANTSYKIMYHTVVTP